MDRNTELLLAKAGQPPRWEDEQKATNDVEQLREESSGRPGSKWTVGVAMLSRAPSGEPQK
jgi:hypothetical protein